jgi:hypothetical protein
MTIGPHSYHEERGLFDKATLGPTRDQPQIQIKYFVFGWQQKLHLLVQGDLEILPSCQVPSNIGDM